MSLWEKYLDNNSFKSIEKNLEVDILIIGGGISGLSTLYFLKDLDVCLVEEKKIGMGISKNTTGKLTYLQNTIYTDLQENVNFTSACTYLKSQIEAISLIKKIIEKENIDCDLERVSSYVVADKEKDLAKLKKEYLFLKKANILVEESSLDNKPAIKVDDTYVFNPLKYLNGLKSILKGKNILENTKITDIKEEDGYFICQANDKIIKAKKVIMACHYPFFIFPFLMPLKSHIEKSYLIAWKVKENKRCSAITVSNPGFSFRYYQDKDQIYQIGLAQSHETAFLQDDKENFLKVQKKFHILDKDIVAKWSNVDIITDDKLPFVGKIKNNLYLLTGFNTWGMTNSIIGAKLISDLVLNKENKYENLFSLKRKNFYKIKNFFINAFVSSKSFIGSKFPQKKWYKNNIRLEKRNGKMVGIYIDESQKEHIVYNLCPHMKCSLIFNEEEKTWDCPCHSSRFDINGKCIKGPSLYDISYKK